MPAWNHVVKVPEGNYTSKNAYEIKSITRIESNGEVAEFPNFDGKIFGNHYCVAIDQTITIFADANCNEVTFYHCFESKVDCFCLIENVIIVGLSEGEICILNISTSELLFHTNINLHLGQNRACFINILKSPNEDNSVVIFTRSGIWYKLSCPNFTECNEHNITITRINYMNEITFAEIFDDFTCIKTKEELNIFKLGQEQPCHLDMTVARKVGDTPVMLGINTSGYLCAFYLPNAISVLIWAEKKLSNFGIVEKEDGTINLLLLTQDRYVILLGYPTLNVIYESKVSSDLRILGECVLLESNLNGNTGVIDIKILTESSPEYRLAKLLNQKRFSDAEQLAQKFELDLQQIYQQKALYFLETNCENDVIPVLDQIDDLSFVINCCSNALFPDYEAIHNILKYGQERLDRSDSPSELNEKLMDLMMRLETYNLIYNHPDYSNDFISGWLEFSKVNIVRAIESLLQNGQFDMASLIWIKFQNVILVKNAAECSQILLNAIPNISSPEIILPWFKLFLKTVLQYTSPNSMPAIIQCAIDKILCFESLANEQWPDNGLEFAEELLQVLNVNSTEQHGNETIVQQFIQANNNLQKLFHVIKCLRELSVLKHQHSVILKLEFYMSYNIETIVIKMLDEVHPDQIDHLFDQTLDKYLLTNGLNSDEVIESYVSGITSDFSYCRIGAEAPWERRVATLLKRIYSLTTRLKSTVKVLERAPVPWTQGMELLAQSALQENHPLTEEIQKQISLVDLKLLYQKYNFKILNHMRPSETLQFIERIIKDEPDGFLEDVKKVLTYYPVKNGNEKFSICFHLITTERLTQLGNYLNELEPRDALMQCNRIIDCMHPLSIETLSIINHKLDQLKADYTVESVVTIRRMNQLHNEYGIDLNLKTPEDMLIQKIKSMEVEVLCKEIVPILKLLGISNEKGFFVCLNQIQDRTKMNILCNYFLVNVHSDVSFDSKIYNSIALKLLKPCDLMETNELIESTRLAVQFSNYALVGQPRMDNFQLSRWIEIFNELCQGVSSTTALNNDLINRISFICTYKDAPIGCNLNVAYNLLYKFLTVALELASHYPKVSGLQIFYENGIPVSEEQLERDFKFLAASLKEFRNYQYDYICFKIVLFFMDLLCHVDLAVLPMKLKEYIKKSKKWLPICKQSLLLLRISRAPKIDVQLAVSLFNGFTEEDINKFINQYLKLFGSDPSKLMSICQVGVSCIELKMLPEQMLPILKNTQLIAKSSKRMMKVITNPIKDIYRLKPLNLLILIVSAEQFEIESILKLIEDFKLDEQLTLQELIKHILLQWKPLEFVPKTNTAATQLTEKCKTLVNLIINKPRLYHMLEQVWTQINFYYYEVYLCLLEILEDQLPDACVNKNFLKFLQTYTRVEPPQQLEVQLWNSKYEKTDQQLDDLPKIATYRLPWGVDKVYSQIYRNEFNLQTCTKWIEIAPIANLDSDMVYFRAIKQTVSSSSWVKKFGNVEAQTEWLFHSKNADILQKIIGFALKIQRIETSVAVLYHVAQQIPPGVERVQVAQTCYNLALKWSQENPNTCIENIKKLYEKNCCLQILHSHGLQNLNVDSPNLLKELYEHQSIIDRAKHPVLNMPDINRAATEIAQVLKINIQGFRYELIDKLLHQHDEVNLIDESFSIELTPKKETKSADETVLRICYILQAEDLQTGAAYLARVGIPNDSIADDKYEETFGNLDLTFSNLGAPETRTGNKIKYRALQCLLSIASSNVIENVTGMPFTMLQKYIRDLFYVIQLEQLGFSYHMETLHNINKDALIRIWSTCSKNSNAVYLLGSLMIDFDIYDKHLWELVLSTLLKFNLVQELGNLLTKLVRYPSILNTTVYIQAWKTVAEIPFQVMPPLGEDEQRTCIDGLIFLMTCPVISKIDIIRIIEQCLRAEQPSMAAVLLPFVVKNKHKELTLKILKNTTNKSILFSDIESLAIYGVATTKQAIRILEMYS